MTRGRWFVVAVFVVALAAALGNLAYQHQRFGPAHDFWGGPMAQAIGQARQVELLRVEAAADPPPGEALSIGALRLRIVARRDVSSAAGLSQLRRSLLDRHSFEWEAPPPSRAPAWRYALRFDDRASAALVISDDGRWIAGPRGVVRSAPHAAALIDFCQRALGASSEGAPR